MIKLIHTILWFLYFFGTLILLNPIKWYIKSLYKRGENQKALALTEKWVNRWAKSVIAVTGVNITIRGKENIPEEPCVFVPNHQGYFDIAVILTCLDKPHSIIAKKELRKFPFVNGWMDLLGCLFLDRENPRQAVTVLNTATSELKENGRSFVIFPEGTRSKGGPTHEFKNGGFRSAIKAKAKIVPICIDGTYKVMEANHYLIKPADIKITILPAIDTACLSSEEAKNIGVSVKAMIDELLPPPVTKN